MGGFHCLSIVSLILQCKDISECERRLADVAKRSLERILSCLYYLILFLYMESVHILAIASGCGNNFPLVTPFDFK